MRLSSFRKFSYSIFLRSTCLIIAKLLLNFLRCKLPSFRWPNGQTMADWFPFQYNTRSIFRHSLYSVLFYFPALVLYVTLLSDVCILHSKIIFPVSSNEIHMKFSNKPLLWLVISPKGRSAVFLLHPIMQLTNNIMYSNEQKDLWRF